MSGWDSASNPTASGSVPDRSGAGPAMGWGSAADTERNRTRQVDDTAVQEGACT